MNTNHSTRRHFLQQSLLLSAIAAFPGRIMANKPEINTKATPNFNADVEIEFSAQPAYIPILRNGPNTQVQKFYASVLKGPQNTLQQLPGNYLGPVLRLQKGQKIRVFFNNKLSEPTIIHWHGLHVPQSSDGHPMYTLQPGEHTFMNLRCLIEPAPAFIIPMHMN